MARVLVPGGGQYRLAYSLRNEGGPENSWQALISSIDGSFPSITLGALIDSDPFPRTSFEFPFTLPAGTEIFILTFEARNDVDWWYVDSVTVLLGPSSTLAVSVSSPMSPTHDIHDHDHLELPCAGSQQSDCANCNSQCFTPKCPGTGLPNCQYRGPCCLDPHILGACHNPVCLPG
eukprot:jgi/Botrbrau1/10887/Bobra.0025s0064.1